MLVPHVFPSDGEYTVTVTPIFGDNMSPTGFGSVPCERLEILLDGDRLDLLNWQGGGRNPGELRARGSRCWRRSRPATGGGRSDGPGWTCGVRWRRRWWLVDAAAPAACASASRRRPAST